MREEDRDRRMNPFSALPDNSESSRVLSLETAFRVLESMPVGVYIMDDSGRIVYGNRAGAEIWQGLKYVGPSEFDEYKAWWYESGEVISAADWAGSRAIRNGETSIDEVIRIQCFDGSSKIILNSALPIYDTDRRIIGAFSINNDITEQKQYEQKLKESEQRFRNAMDDLLEGVQILDFDLRYLYINDAAEKHNRRSKSELLHQRYTDCWREIETLEVYSIIKDCLHNRVPHKMENKFVFPDGETGWFDLSIQPVAEGVLILSVDITHRKYAQSQAQRNQRLESLGFLAAGIAHDYNNLFGGLYGNIDLALMETGEPRVAHILKRCMGTIDQARGLTQQLITFAKGGTPNRTPGPLFPAVAETAQALLYPAKIDFAVHTAPNLSLCNFDFAQIKQAVENIVQNALDAMNGAGRMEITAQNVQLQPAPPPLTDGNYIQIDFHNTGPRIPDNIVDKVFDPFFSTREPGRGLGLSTCHSIVQRHGGTVEIESTGSEGVTVRMYLPVFQLDQTVPAEPKKEPVHRGAGKILLMDDDEIVRVATGEMLKRFGYTVVGVDEGREAVRLFDEARGADQPFYAVILDLTVPGGWGGDQTVQEIRRRDPHVPVFVASGYMDIPIMNEPTRHGFTASIRKPFRIKELARLFEEHRKPAPSS